MVNDEGRDGSLPDLPTVIAIALVAYAASNILHEAVGHGGACIALGGKPLVLSSVHFECGEETMSDVARRVVSAAGTIVNFIAGALALIASSPHSKCTDESTRGSPPRAMQAPP